MRHALIACVLLLAMATITPSAAGQILMGGWIDQAERQIERHRKTALRVSVLDENVRPVPGVAVAVSQRAHQFPIGFTASDTGWVELNEFNEVFRCFNAVSLEAIADWSQVEPREGLAMGMGPLGEHVNRADVLGLTVRWGGMISADPARNPAWLDGHDQDQLADAMQRHAALVAGAFGRRVDSFDVYTHALDHSMVEQRLGVPMLRRLFEQVKARAPAAAVGVRFEDALEGERLRRMLVRLNAFDEQFVPYDRIAVTQRFTGNVAQGPLARSLQRIARHKYAIVVSELEVGGPTSSAAAVNLETVLRTLFAEPTVQGVYLKGLHAHELADPTAALVGEDGLPTAAGFVFDGLFHGQWWTDITHQTDELGSIHTRVFGGSHLIQTTLPDGTPLEAEVWIPIADNTRIIVLQPPGPGVGQRRSVR